MKKKILILSVFSLIVIMLLTGCSININVGDITNNIKNRHKSSNEEMYGSIVNQYKNAFDEFDINDVAAEDALLKKYNMVNEQLMLHVARYDNNVLKYAYYDLDKNGIDELFVGVGPKEDAKAIYLGAIYSYNTKSNKVEKLYFQDTLERGELQAYDNGIIFSNGSGGAALHYFQFGKIASDGYSYEYIEEIEEKFTDGNVKPEYNEYRKKIKLNYQNANEFLNKYIGNSKAIEFDNVFNV